MLTPIRHPKLNTDIAYLHSKSEAKQECVQKTDYKSEQKGITMKQSASVNFTGGFFSPKKNDTVSFSGDKGGFFHKLGQKEGVKKFFRNPKFLKFLEKANGLAMMEAYFVFAISTTLKPFSIELMPGSKKGDKDYNATKSVLAGCVDFVLAGIALKPVEKKLEQFGEKIKKKEIALPQSLKYLEEEANFKTFSKVVGYAPKFLLAPVRSLATIALIPPTLKLLFPEEAKKLKDKKEKEINEIAQTPQTNKPNRQITQVSSTKSQVLAGGVR